MKTLGERIKQAREALGLSGLQLAVRVGYKTQSGISNLEGRATGSGGNKIGEIARALNVSLDWLMHGPDSDQVPFLSASSDTTNVYQVSEQRTESMLNRQPEFDQWTQAAILIMQELDVGQRQAMVAKMREFRQFLGPPSDGQTLSVAS